MTLGSDIKTFVFQALNNLQSTYQGFELINSQNVFKVSVFKGNSADPDQIQYSAVSDLGLHSTLIAIASFIRHLALMG